MSKRWIERQRGGGKHALPDRVTGQSGAIQMQVCAVVKSISQYARQGRAGTLETTAGLYEALQFLNDHLSDWETATAFRDFQIEALYDVLFAFKGACACVGSASAERRALFMQGCEALRKFWTAMAVPT